MKEKNNTTKDLTLYNMDYSISSKSIKAKYSVNLTNLTNFHLTQTFNPV